MQSVESPNFIIIIIKIPALLEIDQHSEDSQDIPLLQAPTGHSFFRPKNE